MTIRETDRTILKSFLERESRMYLWAVTTTATDEGERRREAFVDRTFNTILNSAPKGKFDYVRIQSLTNMGLLDSELVLTSADWGSGQDLICMLPPAPNGGVGFSINKRGS